MVPLAATVGGGVPGEAIVATRAAVTLLEAHALEHRDGWSSLAGKAGRRVQSALERRGIEASVVAVLQAAVASLAL